MRHHEHVVGTLQFGDHRLDAVHRIDVTLAPRITIAQLVLIAPGELLSSHMVIIVIELTRLFRFNSHFHILGHFRRTIGPST